jgi:peptide/nickel transport system substrate-binding protein
MVDRQSMEFDQKKRKELVWTIERKLAEDAARPILWHNRTGTCWHPYVKGYTPMVNSVYNGWRMEDVWLDKYRLSDFVGGRMLMLTLGDGPIGLGR